MYLSIWLKEERGLFWDFPFVDLKEESERIGKLLLWSRLKIWYSIMIIEYYVISFVVCLLGGVANKLSMPTCSMFVSSLLFDLFCLKSWNAALHSSLQSSKDQFFTFVSSCFLRLKIIYNLFIFIGGSLISRVGSSLCWI